MTKRMIIMLLLVVVLVAALAGGFYMHLMKMFASFPKPAAAEVTQPAVAAITRMEPLAFTNQLQALAAHTGMIGDAKPADLQGFVQPMELTTATGYKGLDPSKVDYYFGNLDERRVTWSTGRDLILQPPQEDGPVNALTKIYVEIDGKQSTDWTRELTYTEVTK